MKLAMNNFRISIVVTLLILTLSANAKPPKREFYEIRIYHLKNKNQEARLDKYLQQAYLPALHRAGVNNVGVFKPIEVDTADRKIYLLIPMSSLDLLVKLPETLRMDKDYQNKGSDYIEAPYNNPIYTRIESIILHAFTHMPQLKASALTSPRDERVYELRSYEGHTEKIFKNKVQMFNEGGEVELFNRLGFNAVFYAEVIAGARIPNLMYMTTFENKASRDAHWKAFGEDPQWKKLSGMKEYQNNVSKIDIQFLKPTSYSDY